MNRGIDDAIFTWNFWVYIGVLIGFLTITGCQSNPDVGRQPDPQPMEILSLPDSDLLRLADDLYNRHEHEKVLIVLEECLKRGLQPDESSFRKGVSLFELGRRDDAVESLIKTLEFNPNHLKAHFNLGAIYYENHEFQKSIDNYEAARILKPDDDQTVYGIAASQFALGRYAEAKKNANTALRINPNNTNAKTLLKMLNARN